MRFRRNKKKKKGLTSEQKQAMESQLRGTLEYDVPMSTRTTIKVGGPADAVFAPADPEDVATFVRLASDLHIPYEILGGGTNLLVKDGGYRGVMLDLREGFGYLDRLDDLRVKVGSGAALPTLVARCREWGLKGCEGLAGIPGTVGGAFAMNAGTHEGDVSMVTEQITIVTRSGRVKKLGREELPFEYRDLPLKKGTIILDGTLKFSEGDPKELGEVISESKARRKATQPLDKPNAGCIFKNPEKVPAGKIIDDLGLKGVRLRGAMISDVHANFIVNVGDATAKDILGLMSMIKEKVKDAHGLKLEPEVRIIGEDEEEK